MLVGDFLDGGGRGVSQAVVGASLVVFVLLGVVVLAPVLVVVSLAPGIHLTAPAPRHASPPDSITPTERAPAENLRARAAIANSPHAVGNSAVDVARHYLGIRYVFGGTDPRFGLDCSGLVQLVYRQIGINLPRTAQQQYDATLRVSRADLQPGDLVFFARTYADPHDWVTHVGIYIGDGLQVNAPTEGQTVSIQPVFTGFWGAHFTSGGRPPRANAP